MKKIFILSAAVMLAASVCVHAETDKKLKAVVQDIQQGRDNANQIKVLRVKGAATVGGALSVTGAQTAPSFTATGDVKGLTISIGAGQMKRLGDALIWVEGGVTNTLVADVSS
jgi:hypothetical protein